jgi:hypothetical protein
MSITDTSNESIDSTSMSYVFCPYRLDEFTVTSKVMNSIFLNNTLSPRMIENGLYHTTLEPQGGTNDVRSRTLSFRMHTRKSNIQISEHHLNIPLVLVASIIPDTDLLIPWLEHRSPTHSLILIFLFFLPAFALYREKAAPYFVAGIHHSILGDHFTGEGIQLL